MASSITIPKSTKSESSLGQGWPTTEAAVGAALLADQHDVATD